MGSRNMKERRIHYFYGRTYLIVHFKAWPLEDDDRVILNNDLGIFPIINVLEAVASHDEGKRVTRIFFFEVQKSMGGIGRPR